MTRFLPIAWSMCLIGASTFAASIAEAASPADPAGEAGATDEPASGLSLSQLEHRLSEIDRQLARLSRFSMRTGVGSVGYRSATHEESANQEWIQIDLGGDLVIDQIVLVPAIYRDTIDDFTADGFPREFRIVAGTSSDPAGTVVAAYTIEDHLLPRVAPVVVPCQETKASWIRLEATVLSPRAWDGRYLLQLSEILIFSGEENVALGQPVQVSSTDLWESGARHRRFVVDGFVPYLMNAVKGKQSIAYVSPVGVGAQPELTIDLEETQTLDRIHLHATEVSDTVPQTATNNFGIPRRLVVEGANLADFSDAVGLIEYRKDSIFDAGPIIIRRFPGTSCRYVRLVAVEPYLYIEGSVQGSRIGFAEIELFSQGQNVALGKDFHANFDDSNRDRSLAALTDGSNLFGSILSIRDWLGELALRHDLETERPLVLAELNRRYQRQKTNIRRLIWLAGLLAAGIGITFLIDRMVRMRQLAKMKMRLAADMHDELGANLHTIGLLSDLAEQAKDQPEELSMLHGRIRDVTQRTGTAVRYCTDMLEADGLYTGLVTDMRRASERILARLEHDISMAGEDYLDRLKPRARVDLFLFYKECLINISRHSGATRFMTELKADDRQIDLTISDNGRGLGDFSGNQIPASLRRRARLLGANVIAKRSEMGGTCIQLTLPNRS